MNDPRWNAILRGGPHDGMLLEASETVERIEESGYEGHWGEYTRSQDVEDRRTVFHWHPDESHRESHATGGVAASEG